MEVFPGNDNNQSIYWVEKYRYDLHIQMNS